jgi:diaminopimelate epimerase
MLKIIKSKEVPKDDFFSTENESRVHVTPNEPWIAFELPKEELDSESTKYEIVTLEVTFNEYSQNVTALAINTGVKHYIIAAQGLSYNDLYAAYITGTISDTLEVPKTAAVGFLDGLHRRKYITTTANPFWNGRMLPVVITK